MATNRVNLGNIIGATGATGATGPAGANGADGLTPYIQNGTWWIGTTDTGVTAKGNEWYYGTNEPTSQGNNGDLYLRTSTSDVYKKESGVWNLITNIKGAKGDKGDKGDTALTITIGTVTTVDEEEPASVTNSGTNTDLVLDFNIPKGATGEQGPKGDTGRTTAFVGGFAVDTLSFNSNPQEQIDNLNNNKLSSNQGSENAGKILQVGADGSVTPVNSDAENDVIEGYYYNEAFYRDSEHTDLIIGAEGKLYIDVVNNLQFRYNGSAYVLLTTDISGKADKTQAVGSIELSINSSTFVVTLQAKNVNGQNIGTAQTIDLPLESVVVNGSYNSQTKKVVLTLQNGNTIEFSVADLVAGLQSEITSSNKLDADLVDDTTSTHKFATSSQLSQIATNESNISSLQTNKANKSTIATYTLLSSNWSNKTYTLSVTGKTASNNARVSNGNTGTDAQVLANAEAIADANIYKITDNGTSLTFVCETTPTTDLVIQVEVYE